jgi:hypothetical protein
VLSEPSGDLNRGPIRVSASTATDASARRASRRAEIPLVVIAVLGAQVGLAAFGAAGPPLWRAVLLALLAALAFDVPAFLLLIAVRRRRRGVAGESRAERRPEGGSGPGVVGGD